MRPDGEDLLFRAPQVEGRLEPARAVVERAVRERRVELPERSVGHRERARGHGIRPRPGQTRRGGDHAAHARRVALEQRVHADQRERLELQMGVGSAVRGEVARERELPRPVHALQREAAHAGRRVGHGQLGRPLEHPHVAGELQRQRVDANCGDPSAAREPPARQERPSLADAGTGEPHERVTRAVQRRGGGPEAQDTVRQRIERGVELEHRHRTGPIDEPRPPLPRHRPAAPLQALEARPDVEAERVERPLQAHEHPGRSCERLDRAIVRIARIAARRHVAPRDPAQQRVERVQAVGVEIERQPSTVPATPAQGTPTGSDQAGLHEAQRIDVQVPVRQPHRREPRIERRAGKQGRFDPDPYHPDRGCA